MSVSKSNGRARLLDDVADLVDNKDDVGGAVEFKIGSVAGICPGMDTAGVEAGIDVEDLVGRVGCGTGWAGSGIDFGRGYEAVWSGVGGVAGSGGSCRTFLEIVSYGAKHMVNCRPTYIARRIAQGSEHIHSRGCEWQSQGEKRPSRCV